MSSRLRIAALGVVLAVVAYPLVGAAEAPKSLLGTWKQNVAKSKADPGPVNKSQTSRWETAPGGGAKNVLDGVDGAGKTIHTDVVTMFDGKAVEVKGAAVPTTREYTRIDEHTYTFVDRVNGKVTTTNRGTIAADGKTRTNVATGTDANGKTVNNTTVYDRQ